MLPFWEVVTLVGIPRHRDDPGIMIFGSAKAVVNKRMIYVRYYRIYV